MAFGIWALAAVLLQTQGAAGIGQVIARLEKPAAKSDAAERVKIPLVLLKRAAGIAKGSGAPNKDKVGKVTLQQVEDIAKQKMPDLNAASVDAAIKSIKGTARSMGIKVTA